VGSGTSIAGPSEAPAWAYTAWLLADVLDFAADEQGATAKLTDSLFARVLGDDADNERGS
jgi:hypothetical protein